MSKLVLKKNGLQRIDLLVLILAFTAVGSFFVSRSFADTTKTILGTTCDSRLASTLCGGAVIADGSLSVRRLLKDQVWGQKYDPVAAGTLDVQVCFNMIAVSGATTAVIKHPSSTTKTVSVSANAYAWYCARNTLASGTDTRIKNNGPNPLRVHSLRIVTIGVNPPVVNAPPATYSANLTRIRNQAWRNTNEDSSPYRTLTMQQLDANATAQLNNDKRAYIDGNFQEQWGANDNFGDIISPTSAYFRLGCEFSHFAYDDPVVYPNQPERAHLHMFFGNTDVNAYSTYNTLFNTGGGTCNGNEMNRTGYWAPAVFDGSGNVRVPDFANIYYKNDNIAGNRSAWANANPVTAWPVSSTDTWIKSTYPGTRMSNFQGVQILADNSDRAISMPGPYRYTCISELGQVYSQTNNSITDIQCPVGPINGVKSYFEMNIYFPMCWNGGNPAPYNNGSVGWPLNRDYYWRDCGAAGYNRSITSIIYRIRYEVQAGDNTRNWFLSSDVDRTSLTRTVFNGQALHADWWGAWNPTVVELMSRNCMNVRNTSCGYGYMDGRPYDVANSGSTLRYRRKYTGPDKVPAQQIYNSLCSKARTLARTEQAAWCTAP